MCSKRIGNRWHRKIAGCSKQHEALNTKHRLFGNQIRLPFFSASVFYFRSSPRAAPLIPSALERLRRDAFAQIDRPRGPSFVSRMPKATSRVAPSSLPLPLGPACNRFWTAPGCGLLKRLRIGTRPPHRLLLHQLFTRRSDARNVTESPCQPRYAAIRITVTLARSAETAAP